MTEREFPEPAEGFVVIRDPDGHLIEAGQATVRPDAP
jgi:hypothetical protein